MKLFLFSSLALLSSLSARADVVTCTFTEPFMTVIVNEENEKVTVVNSMNGDHDSHHAHISRLGNAIQVRFAHGSKKSLLTYVHDGNGSDGMSDAIYPYSAQLLGRNGGQLFGGCETPIDRRRSLPPPAPSQPNYPEDGEKQ